MARLLLSILATTIIAGSAGCAKYETPVDSFYGTSYELARQSQIHNPAAGIITGPPLGLEGNVAVKTILRYEKGFDKPAPKTSTYSVDSGGLTIK